MNFISSKFNNTQKYILMFNLLSFIFVCIVSFTNVSPAHAQVSQTCETTMIHQPGIGWIAGSEITTCEITGSPIMDGSQFAEQMNNSCGIGNPCPEAPSDTDERLVEEQQCVLEQVQEAAIDILAQQTTGEIATKNSAIEHGTFIVEHNGTLITLEVVSGNQTALPLNSLYNQMNALGLSDTAIRGFIHSHPASTNSNPIAAAAENLINGFPSDNDYVAYETFASNAVAFGANDSEWRNEFRAYVVDSDGTLREYEGFTQPESQIFSEESGNSIPSPGIPEYSALQNSLDQAQIDADNKCGGN